MKNLFASVLAFAFLFVGYANASAETDRDCGEFSSNEAVMDFWYANGYSADDDPHDLDRDSDGLPCEVSQGEYDQFVASQQNEDNTTDSDSESSTGAADTSGEDNTASGDSSGEELPDTATNSVMMIGLGALLLFAGTILVFQKKQIN
ncbi:LPXTG cell wall anchor domain-containing protein [Peribacillus sp. SCS-155]|uniref:LPXTG cell wall anchor domain-containing protein n=1 Tax=Peribacillus sedimenti TaxID=3115297 RepID=UPI00390653B2